MDELESLDGGLLTVDAATELLSIGRSTLYSAMERGELAFCRFGRARRIPRRVLLAWAASKMQGGWATMPGATANGFGRNEEDPETQRALIAGKHPGPVAVSFKHGRDNVSNGSPNRKPLATGKN